MRTRTKHVLAILISYLLVIKIVESFVFSSRFSPFLQHNHQRSHWQWQDGESSVAFVASSMSSNDHGLVTTVEEASEVLKQWDSLFNPDSSKVIGSSMEELFDRIEGSVLLLNQKATELRERDSTKGRVMLGICASSATEGVGTLKQWVTTLQLPRGLLHGMDKDGVPIEMDGAVYIKYNSGGVYTFTDIRKSGLGFDALWKPGDALIEPYNEGNYRGVYFQVELDDSEFRQYLMPLDLFQ